MATPLYADVHVPMEETVLPMIPSGASLDEIVCADIVDVRL